MPASLQLTFDFLRDLRANNNKAWFDAHRAHYTSARDAFEGFITDILYQFNRVEDLSGVTAKDCIYRINRDVRFSADKSPYKSTMSAVLGQGGRKAQGRSYYLQFEPDNGSFIAGGMYEPSKEQLERIRQDIVYRKPGESGKLRQILEDAPFVQYFGKMGGDSLKNAPQGYAKDHPDIDLLRYKQFLASHPLSDQAMLSDDVTEEILNACAALKPFVSYFHDITAA